jgi:hypothetical protein
MKTHPILFSKPMVDAILAGRKTQTRRIVNPQPNSGVRRCFIGPSNSGLEDGHGRAILCKYGLPEDYLVMLCTWAVGKEYDKIRPNKLPEAVVVWHQFLSTPKPEWCGKSRPGRFMPSWMRKQMPVAEIKEIRLQRLQEITEEDAKAEGVTFGKPKNITKKSDQKYGKEIYETNTPRAMFAILWDSINGKKAPWKSNPWVWVLKFSRPRFPK